MDFLPNWDYFNHIQTIHIHVQANSNKYKDYSNANGAIQLKTYPEFKKVDLPDKLNYQN